MPGVLPLTVVVLTKDEERLIARCLRSVTFADEVVVVDSGSTDRTREIAASLGARVHEQTWLGWSHQRNRGAALGRNDWVFCLEADEVVTPELEASLRRALTAGPDPRDGFSVQRRDDFLGALMPSERPRARRAALVRVFNRLHSAYDPSRAVHEEVRLAGRAHPLDGVLLHWRGSGVDAMAATANRYAGIEAAELERAGVSARGLDVIARPLARFAWCYFARRGYRLGVAGLGWSLMRASAEFLRYLKLWESHHRDAIAADPPPAVLADPDRRGS